jgi:hypothetical protein
MARFLKILSIRPLQAISIIYLTVFGQKGLISRTNRFSDGDLCHVSLKGLFRTNVKRKAYQKKI